MTAIASHFEAMGMTAEQAASREALFDQLAQRAGAILDGPPAWRRFTPGRVEIFGKHTDYAGGHSLLAAVPRGIALVARPRSDGIVRIGDIFDGQVVEVDPTTEAPAHYRGRSTGRGSARARPGRRVRRTPPPSSRARSGP